MQGGDLAGELSQRAFRRNGARRAPAIEANVVAACHGEPPAVARRVHRHDRLGTSRVAAILGTTRVRRSGSWPCGPRAPESIQAAISAISSAAGRGSSSGGIIGLAAPVKTRMMRLPLASPGKKRGAVRGPALQRGVAFEREFPLAILIVMAARAVLLEQGSDSCRVIGRRSSIGGGRSRDNAGEQERQDCKAATKSLHGNNLDHAMFPPFEGGVRGGEPRIIAAMSSKSLNTITSRSLSGK